MHKETNGWRRIPPKERMLRELWETPLSKSAVLVGKSLLNFMKDESLSCHPGTNTLVAFTGLSRSSVFRALSELRAKGVIDIRPGWHSNRYAFWCAPPHGWFRDISTANSAELKQMTDDAQKRSRERKGIGVSASPFTDNMSNVFNDWKDHNLAILMQGMPDEYMAEPCEP